MFILCNELLHATRGTLIASYNYDIVSAYNFSRTLSSFGTLTILELERGCQCDFRESLCVEANGWPVSLVSHLLHASYLYAAISREIDDGRPLMRRCPIAHHPPNPNPSRRSKIRANGNDHLTASVRTYILLEVS